MGGEIISERVVRRRRTETRDRGRTFFRRLGMTLKLRDRVYEISGTDPVRITIVGAELHVSPTNA